MQAMFQGLPAETRALRAMFAPLPSQDPLAGRDAPLTFGRQADAYLRERHVDHSHYLTILRARLYSANGRAFGYALRMELGWTYDTGEALWDLIELPL